jgi:hypothetical protein
MISIRGEKKTRLAIKGSIPTSIYERFNQIPEVVLVSVAFLAMRGTPEGARWRPKIV